VNLNVQKKKNENEYYSQHQLLRTLTIAYNNKT